MDAKWSITPPELLTDLGWQFKRKGNWLAMRLCPFCQGGDHRDIQTFIVHAIDGNFSCSRAKCGSRGTFWALLEAAGRQPRDYFGERTAFVPQKKKKRFIYGR